MEDVSKLKQQIKRLQAEIQKQEEILQDQQKILDSLKFSESDLQMMLAKIKQKYCEHQPEIHSFRLEAGKKIRYFLKCSKCDKELEPEIHEDETFASQLEYGRTYYIDYFGGMYFVEDNTPNISAFELHLKKNYLPVWSENIEKPIRHKKLT